MDKFDLNNDNLDFNGNNNLNQSDSVDNTAAVKSDTDINSTESNNAEGDTSRYNTFSGNTSGNYGQVYNNSGYNKPGYNNAGQNDNPGSQWKNTAGGYADSLRTSPYYTESYRKQSRGKGGNMLQFVLVALISSILGGGIVGAFMIFAAPIVQIPMKGYLDKLFPANAAITENVGGSYKKVEIEKSESPVSAIAEKVSPSIVGIRVTAIERNLFFQTEVNPEGSGIILKSDGYILTNNHVIQSAIDYQTGKISNSAKIEVILPNKKDEPYTAQLIGRDPDTDLAIIKIDETGLPAAEMGDSDTLKVGELAVAIGNPGGMEFMGSVSVGVISGLNRTVAIDETRELKVIQTDASINPGNSGGALVNSEGKVIGVNTLKAQTQLGFDGMGFALPINEVKQIAESLMTSGYVKGRPKLGVYINPDFNEDVAKQYKVPMGLLIDEVQPFSAAYKAGLQKMDIILKFDGKPVKTFNELEKLKDKHKPGDTVEIEIYREEETMVIKVTLGEDTGN